MPKLGPTKRKNLIKHLRQLGFDGPFSGGSHLFMQRGKLRVRVPNPHQTDISRGLVVKILDEAGIEKSEWESL